ncbi:hypothetical protein BHE74_00035361 [Ensete ventricosum]|nr:hypothetical protein BHE74_00035361 [Ensete ventricosum]
MFGLEAWTDFPPCHRVCIKKGHLFGQFKCSATCLASATFCTGINDISYMKKSSIKCRCQGTLMNPETNMPNNWIPLVNQFLLTVSVIFAYLAGVVPRDIAFSSVQDGTTGLHCDDVTSSYGRKRDDTEEQNKEEKEFGCIRVSSGDMDASENREDLEIGRLNILVPFRWWSKI